MRIAFSNIVANTGSSSPGELLMTCSTSEVAGSAPGKLARALLLPLNKRTFSMAIAA